MKCRVAVNVGACHVYLAQKCFQHFRSAVVRRQMEISISVQVGGTGVGAQRQKAADLVHFAGLNSHLRATLAVELRP